MSNILWVIVVLLLLGSFAPSFGWTGGYRHPAYAGPSIWTIVVILILLRVFGII